MSEMRLSDDELVAIAVMEGRAWVSPLPTVDQTSASELMVAARRGERSLYLRNLLSQDQDSVALLASTAALLSNATRESLIVLVSVVREGLQSIPEGLTYVHYGSEQDDYWLTESVSSGGVHYFGQVPHQLALQGMRELVDAAFRSGIDPPPPVGAPSSDTVFLALTRPASGGAAVLLVAAGKLILKYVSGETGEVTEVSRPNSTTEALDTLRAGSVQE